MNHNMISYILVMAAVTFVIRALPLTLIRKAHQEPVPALLPVLCALCDAGGDDLSGHPARDGQRVVRPAGPGSRGRPGVERAGPVRGGRGFLRGGFHQ